MAIENGWTWQCCSHTVCSEPRHSWWATGRKLDWNLVLSWARRWRKGSEQGQKSYKCVLVVLFVVRVWLRWLLVRWLQAIPCCDCTCPCESRPYVRTIQPTDRFQRIATQTILYCCSRAKGKWACSRPRPGWRNHCRGDYRFWKRRWTLRQRLL